MLREYAKWFQTGDMMDSEHMTKCLDAYCQVSNIHIYLRNRMHFPCFHTITETQVEIWEIEKLQWEHETVGRVFPRYFESTKLSLVLL